MSLKATLNELNARLQTVLKPGVDDVLERHIAALKDDGTLGRVLAVGQRAPKFTLQNQRGELVSSATLLARGPLVVAFTRGVWCPFCIAEIKAINAVYADYEREGVKLVMLMPQALSEIASWSREVPVRFDLLRDEDNRIGLAFGVVYDFPPELKQLYLEKFDKDIPAINASGAWQLPFPARFILDGDGVVQDAEAEPNYRVRPEPEEALQIIRGWPLAARSA